MLGSHHFRLGVCRFVIDLFDKRVMRQIVLEEDEDEEDWANAQAADDTDDSESEERERNGSAMS